MGGDSRGTRGGWGRGKRGKRGKRGGENAVKNDPAYTKKLTAWLKQIRQQYKSDPWPATDPLTRMVLGFLQWNATRKQADLAFGRLMHALVDINDLRVSHPQEIIGLLGERYPRVHERAARLHDVLQMVFEREHAVSLQSLEKKSRKEVIAYLTSLPGMVTYVAAQMLLMNFNEPCIAVDDAMLDRLKAQELVSPTTSLEEAAAQIFKLIKPAEAVEVHQAMRAWSDATPLSANSASASDASHPATQDAPTKEPKGKSKSAARPATKTPEKPAAKAETKIESKPPAGKSPKSR